VLSKHATPAGAPWLYADAPLAAMREAPMGAFGIVERFSTLRPDRLKAPAFDGVLDLAGWNCGSAIVHARSCYRAFWSVVRQLMPAGRRRSRAGAAKARKKLSYTATAFVPLGAVPGNM
jgi:hypothetical protein